MVRCGTTNPIPFIVVRVPIFYGEIHVSCSDEVPFSLSFQDCRCPSIAQLYFIKNTWDLFSDVQSISARYTIVIQSNLTLFLQSFSHLWAGKQESGKRHSFTHSFLNLDLRQWLYHMTGNVQKYSCCTSFYHIWAKQNGNQELVKTTKSRKGKERFTSPMNGLVAQV